MAFEENENRYSHLEELGSSDYKIVEGEPDITGWDVIDAQGQKIGEVEDVLFDPQTRDVRYIIVDLEENELDLDVDKKVLVPIGIAELVDDDSDVEDEDIEVGTVVDEDDNLDDEEEYYDEVVVLPNVTVEQLIALPAYEKGKLTPESESFIRNIFEGPTVATSVYERETFYTHDHFNNKLFDRNADNLPMTTDSTQPEDFDESGRANIDPTINSDRRADDNSTDRNVL
jgi:sporulation protein YlmC with PRC-barrel domain